MVSTKGVEGLCCNTRQMNGSRNILRQHQYLQLLVQTDWYKCSCMDSTPNVSTFCVPDFSYTRPEYHFSADKELEKKYAKMMKYPCTS